MSGTMSIRVLSLLISLFVAAVLISACGPPSWLAGACTVEELLSSPNKFTRLTLVAGDQNLLLVGLHQTAGAQHPALFAARLDSEGKILDRWILEELKDGEDCDEIQAISGEKSVAVMAVVKTKEEQTRARVWLFAADCSLQGSKNDLSLSTGKEENFTVGALHLVPLGESFFLVYRIDYLGHAARARSEMVCRRADVIDKSAVKALFSFDNPQDWELLSIGGGEGHLAVVWGERKPDRRSVFMGAFDAEGANIGRPILLYDAPRRYLPVSMQWGDDGSEWALLWGSQKKKKIQHIPFHESGLEQIGPELAVPVEFGSEVVAFNTVNDDMRFLLLDARRLSLVRLDKKGRRRGKPKDLLEQVDIRSGRFHLLSIAMGAQRIAVLYSSDGEASFESIGP